MKFIVTYFLFFTLNLITFWAQSQNINNFLINESKVEWQMVYSTEMSFEELYTTIVANGLIENPVKEDSFISGKIRQIDADYKGAGYKEMQAPIYIARSHIDAFLIIDFKNGKYRVTLKDIKLVQKYSDGLSKQGQTTDLEAFALKSNGSDFKPIFTKAASEILNFTFTNRFKIQPRKIDEW